MKNKSHARFGSKYGKRIREDVLKAEAKHKARYQCPSCSRIAVIRKAAGVWSCRKCNMTFASGAYEFHT